VAYNACDKPNRTDSHQQVRSKKMRFFPILLFVLLTGCRNDGTPFAAPSPSDVSSMTAQLYNRRDGGADITKFEIPKSSRQAILDGLNGARQDNNPMKWQVLGDIEMTLSTGSVDVSLFQTGKKLSAFRANGTYYRGCSDADFIRLISTAKKLLSEQGDAANPAKPGG
jgi:hypothetical protein